MGDVIAWIRNHTWETVSAVLGVGLVVALSFLFSGGDDSSDSTVPASTSTTSEPSTTAADDTATTGAPSEGVGTTTTVAQIPEGVTAVVVDNVPDVGLQIGLNQADLIIETPVEGGLSRFTAFYGQEVPEIVGPVRSLRPVSADLLAPFAPVVFTTGGQPFVVGAVQGAGATIVTPEESIAFQSLERPQPHHVFVSTETEEHEGAPLAVPWEAGEWQGGEQATEISLPIAGGVTWRFEDGVYVRYRDSEPQQVLAQVDSDPEPLTRETLIVLVANQKSAGYTDSAGAEVPNFDVVGGGDVYVFHTGEMVEGTWFRADQTEGYVFTSRAGASIPIPHEASHLVIVPSGQEVLVDGS
jgi:hypothetical protein